jgi:hypothetical protein
MVNNRKNDRKISRRTSSESEKSGFQTGRGQLNHLDTCVEKLTVRRRIKAHRKIVNHFAARTKSAENLESGDRDREYNMVAYYTR